MRAPRHPRTFNSSIFSTPGDCYVAASGITQHFETRTRWRNSKTSAQLPRTRSVRVSQIHTRLLFTFYSYCVAASPWCSGLHREAAQLRDATELWHVRSEQRCVHVSVVSGLVEKLRNLVSVRHEDDGRGCVSSSAPETGQRRRT